MRGFRRKLVVGASVFALLLGIGAAQAGEKPLPSGMVRLAGADRYSTSAAISSKSFTAPVPALFVATGQSFPDALAGGPAAARLGGPVLLVEKDRIRPAIRAEIERLAPESIYVLGGSTVISTAVLRELQGLTSGNVVRLSGADRYETAAAVSQEIWPSRSSTVFLASGANFADALGGGAAAAHRDAPLLLTHPAQLSAATKAELQRLAPSRVYVLGGSVAVSGAVVTSVKSTLPGVTVTRLSGADRYETSAAIAQAIWPSGANAMFFATGASFPDALSGTPAAHVNGAPLLLAKKDCVNRSVMELRDSFSPGTVAMLGGTSVLTSAGLNKICGVTATGIGDDIIKISKPGGSTKPVIVTATHNGRRNFIVWGLDSNGGYNDLLVNEIGPYSGRTILDEGPFTKPSTHLQIDADGRWTITLSPLSTARSLTTNTTGSGDDVLKWGGSSRTARFTHSGSSNFIVWAYDVNGELHALLVNDIGSYNGTRLIPAGTRYLSVEADGNWTIKLQ
jgi:putative cell wall-binding protein